MMLPFPRQLVKDAAQWLGRRGGTVPHQADKGGRGVGYNWTMPKKRLVGRCSCCCQGWPGATLLNFLAVVPCVCPEASGVSGQLQKVCDAVCNDASPPVPVPIGTAGPTVIINTRGPLCDSGWHYRTQTCCDGTQGTVDPNTGRIQTGLAAYCCCQWNALSVPDSQTPSGTMTGGCASGATDPCVSAAAFGCLKTYQSITHCKHGPYAGPRCGFIGAVAIDNYHACSGLCFNSGFSGSTYVVNYKVDCSVSQDNLLGCNTDEPIDPADPNAVLDPISGRYRRKLFVHLTADGITGPGGGPSCTSDVLKTCYMEVWEP
jgi:hypothetical protein